MAGNFEGGNELSCSVICGEILDYLRKCQLLKKDSAPWISLVSYLYNEHNAKTLFPTDSFYLHFHPHIPPNASW